MEKISWTDHVRNEEVLLRVKTGQNHGGGRHLPPTRKRPQTESLCHQSIHCMQSINLFVLLVQLPLHYSLHTRSNKNIRLHDGQLRKYRTCTDCDYTRIKGISRGSYCSVASAEKKPWRPQIYRSSRRGKSLDKLSDSTAKASTFMLVTLKVSHSELLDFECQSGGTLVDGRKVMEATCLKR